MDDVIRILAVDDERFNLLLLQSCLKDDKYQLTTCKNAIDALALFKRGQYDVVLLDVMMEGIDGFGVRALIRKQSLNVPIIFLTSMVDDMNSTLLSRVTEDQFSYYMSKSFRKETLTAKIDAAVQTYRQSRDAERYYHRLEEHLDLAGDVQKIMFPKWCIKTDAYCISYLYEPFLKVSGDVVEVIDLPDDRCFFFIGDIAGHGIQAALYTAAIQYFLKSIVPQNATDDDIYPHVILNKLSRFFISELHISNYITCIAAIFDFKKNHLTYQTAGHPELIRCQNGNPETQLLNPKHLGGIPIGMMKDTVYLPVDNVELDFDDDDIFIGHTDGLLDVSTPKGESAGEDVVYPLFAPLAMESDSVSIPFRIRAGLEQIGYNVVSDDICVVSIQKSYRQKNTLAQTVSTELSKIGLFAESCDHYIVEHLKNQDLADRVELLLNEFMNNIAIHGFESSRESLPDTYIEMKLLPESITISVMDRGKKWDYDEDPAGGGDPVLEKRNDERATSGRGIAIIQTIASSIRRNHYAGLNVTEFSVPIASGSQDITITNQKG